MSIRRSIVVDRLRGLCYAGLLAFIWFWGIYAVAWLLFHKCCRTDSERKMKLADLGKSPSPDDGPMIVTFSREALAEIGMLRRVDEYFEMRLPCYRFALPVEGSQITGILEEIGVAVSAYRKRNRLSKEFAAFLLCC